MMIMEKTEEEDEENDSENGKRVKMRIRGRQKGKEAEGVQRRVAVGGHSEWPRLPGPRSSLHG